MKHWKLVILDGERTNPGDLSWEPLEALGRLTVYPGTAPEELVSHIGDNEIVILDKPVISREVLEACPSVKLITLFATGFNHIDIEAARELGITVCNAPGYSSWAVSQLAAALLLEITTQVGQHSSAVRRGEWKDTSYFCRIAPGLTEIAGKTVGIIGYGGIGQAFGRIMQAMGAELLVFSRHTHPELEDRHTHYASLDRIYAESDVISLHCPMNADSAGIINKESLAKMKDGTILINTSRGGLIVEEDVAAALRSGKLRALGQDAFTLEPIRPDNPLLNAPNTYLTPHMGWAPRETRARLIALVADNIRGFQQGNPRNVVNGVG
ncbi:MAG: D-2-hydroxyacid dehydrogenase [Oscillospiraceae bacterium]|nr:D-2-hydroxyacid dehydrogenase [Oscillospiraceae bacterium]